MEKKYNWFRVYNSMVDNEKLRLLAFEDRWHYVAILCLTSEGLMDQPVSDLRDRKIAVKLGLTVRECEEVKRRLSEVELVDDDMRPLNWDAKQFKSDNSTERTREYRARKAAEKTVSDGSGRKGTQTNRHKNVTETSQERHRDALDTETETETDTEKHTPKPPKGAVHRQQAISLGVSGELWDEYLKTRKRVKATNSPLALTTLINRLRDFESQGYSPASLVEDANMSGWKTVYPPKQEKSNARKSVAERAYELATDTSWFTDQPDFQSDGAEIPQQQLASPGRHGGTQKAVGDGLGWLPGESDPRGHDIDG